MSAFFRYHAGSIAATAVDFSVMIALVSAFGLGPAAATAIGAAAGAVTSFLLGRHWIFRASSGPAGGQALRYALVSAASLFLNAAGEHVLAEIEHVEYIAARVMVGLAVGILWNFPMQRAYVFRAAPTT